MTGNTPSASALPVWRSLLYVPANVRKYVDKAHTRGADAIQLALRPVHERRLRTDQLRDGPTHHLREASVDVHLAAGRVDHGHPDAEVVGVLPVAERSGGAHGSSSRAGWGILRPEAMQEAGRRDEGDRHRGHGWNGSGVTWRRQTRQFLHPCPPRFASMGGPRRRGAWRCLQPRTASASGLAAKSVIIVLFAAREGSAGVGGGRRRDNHAVCRRRS